MLGQLQIVPGRWNRVKETCLGGHKLLQACIDPEGFLGESRMKYTLRRLRRAGAVRTILPRGFECPAWLEATGLRTIDWAPFLRAQSPELALEALRRQDIAPERATVALCGKKVDRDMTQAACTLCAKVRHLVIAVPEGGETLAHWLRWEFGVPILPMQESAEIAMCFQPPTEERGGEPTLELYGRQPNLLGITLAAPALSEEQRENLDVLSVLWEWGELSRDGLKFT